MIYHKELITEFKKQIQIWREYKEKIIELQDNFNIKKNKNDKSSDTDESKNKDTESKNKDSESKDSDESKNSDNKSENSDESKNSDSKSEDSDESKNSDNKSKDSDESQDNINNSDAKHQNDLETSKKNAFDNKYINFDDTIETEEDYKNTANFKNDLKNKTKLGKKILKSLRLLFLRLMIKTHPDKVGEKFLIQFKEAKNAHENYNIDDLIIIAIEVGSSIDNLPIDIDIKVLLEAILYKIQIYKNILHEHSN